MPAPSGGSSCAPLILEGDNLTHLRGLDSGSVQMVYADPPFNTGRTQTRRSLATVGASENGDRTGFGGRRYATKLLSESSYKDHFDDYLGFLTPRLEELRRVLHPTGTVYVHLDYREAHYVKLLLDELFGRENFLNELIWAYDYGAKPQGSLAAEARHDPRVCERRTSVPLRLGSGRPRAVHGPGARHTREGRQGQAPGVGDVAHDRLPDRP